MNATKSIPVMEEIGSSSAARLSVVIVTWNAKQYTEECLHSLENQKTSVSPEIIVVDNASSDGTDQLVREQFPQVELIQTGQNLGFAKGNNIGVRKSTGDYIFLINSDVNVPPGCLKQMAEFMEQHPDIGVLGPQMLGPKGEVRRSAMRFPTLWNSFCRALALDSVFKGSKLFGGYLMRDFQHDRQADVEVLNGWFWMVRRTALAQAGLLDESFFMYGEDMDWCRRFHQAGWRVVFYPEAKAVHYGGASSANAPVRFYIEKQRANLHYFAKNHGWAAAVLYWAILLLQESLRVPAYALRYVLFKSHRIDSGFKLRRSIAGLGWLVGIRAKSQTISGGTRPAPAGNPR